MKKYRNVLTLSIVWAGYYVIAGICNKEISPFITGIYIRFFTFLFLTAKLTATGKFRELFQTKGIRGKLFCVGILGFLLDITAFMGLQYSSSAIGTVLLKTDVIMINIASIWIYGIKFRPRDWFFTLTMLVGVLIVMGINPASLDFVPTDLFFLASAAFVSTNAILIKHIKSQKVVQVSDDIIAYYNNFVTMVIFFLTSMIAGVFYSISIPFQNTSLLITLAAGGVGQFLIYFFYYKSLGELPVWVVKVILLLVPVLSMIFEVVFLKKSFDLTCILGSALVIASAVFIILGQEKKNDPKPVQKC